MEQLLQISFAPISNAAAATRKIKGVLTVEVKDKSNGWIFDYSESKQHFKDWFNEIYNATGGKSWGNVRLMHQLRVVGKICEEPVFDDPNKCINCVVEVTEDEAWQMVENGVLCGFSFSGVKVPPTQEVLAKWANMPDGTNRYIGRPVELSIVDNPNQRGSYWEIVNNTFEFITAEGTSETREFKISNTSFYALSDLAEVVASLRWMTVGEDLQDEFNKCVNGLIGVVAKMGKNLKSEHKDDTSEGGMLSSTENTVKGIVMTDKEKEAAEAAAAAALANAGGQIMNAAQMTEMFQTTVANAVSGLKTDLVTMINDAVKTQVELIVKTQVETISNSVQALTEKLEKTPAETTVVSRDGVPTPVFNVALNTDLNDSDKAALALINKVITPVTKQ